MDTSALIVNYLERKSFYMLLGTLKSFAGYFARLKGRPFEILELGGWVGHY